MSTITALAGETFAEMLSFATANLRKHAKEINDLNVFPIPDGDTGDNMLLTLSSGVGHLRDTDDSISEVARRASDGMLLGARGNSGVILSQIFDGIAEGLDGLYSANTEQLTKALRCGVTYSYNAVAEPAEGTILTVMRCAVEHIENERFETCNLLLREFILNAEQTLEKTPEMLGVLKKAGVVDSGGAGIVCIFKGMLEALEGGKADDDKIKVAVVTPEVNVELFTSDSILEYGYCTELLIRLQKCKTDIEKFDTRILSDELKNIGDSIAVFKTGSAVKLHIHTYFPDKVLAFCQKYGEFLKVKIENMSLQHNNIPKYTENKKERKKYGVVACASGEGIVRLFSERGADVVVDGADGANPSVENFIKAFEKTDADNVFVLPNNANAVLAARQAGDMYNGAKVCVIESKNIGEGIAALSVMSFESDDTARIAKEMIDGMRDVATAEVSQAVKDADEVKCGEYIGYVGKNIISNDKNRYNATCSAAQKLSNGDFETCILIFGAKANAEEAGKIEEFIRSKHRKLEVFTVNGSQDLSDYIIIFE